jgi:hypothetical protein
MPWIRLAGPALVAAALLAACTEQNAPTETTRTIEPKFDISNAPGESGLHVIRGGIFLEYWLIRDPEAGLAVALGSADGFPICGESFTEERFLDIMFIGSRADPERDPDEPDALLAGLLMQALLKGEEIFATVYSLEGEFTDDCDFLLNGTKLAEGTVRMVGTDNDFNAFVRGEPIRADAFGFTAHGIVNLTGGGTARLNATDREVFFPPDEVKVTTTISLIPIH